MHGNWPKGMNKNEQYWWDECFRLVKKIINFQSFERKSHFEIQLNELNKKWINRSNHNQENKWFARLNALDEEINREFIMEKLES